jgi:adenylate cyclase
MDDIDNASVLLRYLPRLVATEDADGRADVADFPAALLVSDIVGSTDLAEAFAADAGGAEAFGALLDEYFGTLFRKVIAHGGDVLRLDGDAMFALWRGADEASAVQQAIGLAQGLRRLSLPVPGHAGRHLQQRLALTCGTFRFRTVTGTGQRDFSVLDGEAFAGLSGLLASSGAGDLAVCRRAAVWLPPTPLGRAALAEAAAPVAAPAALTSAHLRLVTPHIRARAASSGQAWLADFREVSVVFAGMPFPNTAKGAEAGLRTMVRTIEHALAPLDASITDLINGDKGLVAVIAFGVPLQGREDNAAWATEAAWRIHQQAAAMGLRLSIGLASGRAFCGDVGCDERREALTVGTVFVRAARLMQAARPGEAPLCDTTTRAAAQTRFRFASTPSALPLPGVAPNASAHHLLGADMGLMPGTAPSPCTAMIGRGGECAVIAAWLGELDRVGRRLLLLEGEPGCGKTHLMRHAAGLASAAGLRVLSCQAAAIEQMATWFPMRALLLQLLGLQPTATPQQVGAAVLALIGDHPEAQTAAILNDILPVELPTPHPLPIGVAARYSAIQTLVLRLAGRAATEQPILVLADDLHWMDAASAQLLLALSGTVPRLLVLGATRPQDEAGLPLRALLDAAAPRLRLERLGAEATAEIAAARVRVGALPPRLARFVDRYAEGLPLHAEQLMLALVERGVVSLAAGHCQLTTEDLEGVPVPTGIRDLIVSRIDTLAFPAQLVARSASVIGRGFDLALLARVHPDNPPVDRLLDWLQPLVQAGLLDPAEGHTAPPMRAASYRFHHASIREAIYSLLTAAQRRTLHRRAAIALEAEETAARDNSLAELAEHWEQAAEPATAVGYRIRAAQHAVSRYAHHDAVAHAERAERLIAAGGVALGTAQRIALARVYGDACQEMSRFPEAARHLASSAALTGVPMPRSGWPMRFHLLAELARQALHRAGLSRAPASAEAAARAILSAHIYTRFAEHAYFNNDANALVYFTLAALNRAEKVRAVRPMVEGYGGLAIGLGSAGLGGAARFYRDRAVALAETAGTCADQGFGHMLAAVQAFSAGDWPALDRHTTRGAACCVATGDRFREQTCRLLRGYGLVWRGAFDDAAAAFLEWGPDARRIENEPVRAWCLAGLAGLDMLRGAPPQRLLDRLAAVPAGSLHPGERLLCQGLIAAALLRQGDDDAAAAAAEAALAALRGGAPTMGIAYLSLAAALEVRLVQAARGGAEAPSFAVVGEHVAHLRRYARRVQLAQPLVAWLGGRLAQMLHQDRRGEAQLRRGAMLARRVGLPVEQALCEAREWHGAPARQALWGAARPGSGA